jgi:hypothetical protein
VVSTPEYRKFHAACWEDHELARQMLAADPGLRDIRSGLGETVLHDSAIENGIEAVRFCLAHSFDPDPRNQFGNSALQECALICRQQHDLTQVIGMMLNAGADPHYWSQTMLCAWHYAQKSHFEPFNALFAGIPSPTGEHLTCDYDRRTDELLAEA